MGCLRGLIFGLFVSFLFLNSGEIQARQNCENGLASKGVDLTHGRFIGEDPITYAPPAIHKLEILAHRELVLLDPTFGSPRKLSELLPHSLLLPEVWDSYLNYGQLESVNCFGFAHYFHHPRERVRYLAHEEFEKYLRTHFERLPNENDARFGDLIVFGVSFLLKFSAAHAAIYIGDGWILHKPSGDPRNPPVFEKLDKVIEQYAGFQWRSYRKVNPL